MNQDGLGHALPLPLPWGVSPSLAEQSPLTLPVSAPGSPEWKELLVPQRHLRAAKAGPALPYALS